MDISKKREMLYKCSTLGLQEAINTISEILQNPIILFDTSYKYFTCTDNYITSDPIWNEFITEGRLSHKTMDGFNQAQIIQAVADSDVVSIIKSPTLTCDRMNGKIFGADNIQIANFNMMAEQTPLTPEHPELLEIACEVIAPILLASEFFVGADPLFNKSTFIGLIEGEVPSKNELADLYNNLKQFLFIAVIDPINYEKTNTHLGYFKDLFKQLQPEHRYYTYQHQVVALINTDFGWISPLRDMPKIAEFCDKYNISTGVSSSFEDLYLANEKYREAISALNYGEKSRRAHRFYNYESFRLERYLNARRNADEFISPLARAMRLHDETHGTDYVNIFYMHALHGMNVQQTAVVCNRSIEQVSIALNDLSRLYGIDFTDGDMLANMLYSIRLLENEKG